MEAGQGAEIAITAATEAIVYLLNHKREGVARIEAAGLARAGSQHVIPRLLCRSSGVGDPAAEADFRTAVDIPVRIDGRIYGIDVGRRYVYLLNEETGVCLQVTPP